MRRRGFVLAVALPLALLLLGTTVSADSNSVIDFEGLAEGAVVGSVSGGAGISGDDPGGSVGVLGTSADPAIVSNAAIVFDSACGGGCSGEDIDLLAPELGNTLIIAEDLVDTSPADGNVDDPDDADRAGASFAFDFSGWGTGTVNVHSVTIFDVEVAEGEDGATADLYNDGALVATVALPATGNNIYLVAPVGVSDVDLLVITLKGSGAIDNVVISQDVEETANARITGGGHQLSLAIPGVGGSARVTKGLTLHCDITLSNNLEINWPGGNNWHIDKFVDDALCLDDPDFAPTPPPAPADTYIGVDVGTLNGVEGSVACWIFEDHGEPGTSDRGLIHVFAAGAAPVIDLSSDDPCLVAGGPGPDTVLLVPLAEITGGNLQFHYDQPHK